MSYIAGEVDIVVIGAGHAGIEACLAAARKGLKTLVVTLNLDSIGNMPCNPNIGGTAKGHLVREIDALGGQMGKTADSTFIQSKILNASKGPAVFSLRAQIDRRKYQAEMKRILEEQENLWVRQAEVTKILTEDKKVTGVELNSHAIFKCKAVIMTTGTYLKSRIIMGEVSFNGGPDGMFPANYLSQSLLDLGIELFRFKTGTPARVNRRSVEVSGMEPQEGDPEVLPFSFAHEDFFERWNKDEHIENPEVKTLVTKDTQALCWLTHTNEKTHKIIRDNLHRAPMYSGDIKGVGPRYCPSIEDKIVRFADKPRHQVFIEPMGLDTEEMYVQGMSTSLPEEVQLEMYKSIEGLEDVEIMRSAYAIEYDCINATQLKLSLEFKEIEGLFSAGQINGTSGYEEAAAQGLIAGINAAAKLKGEEALVLDRSQAYIGVLIDDIITKGTHEPYRMMTSRAEYRLVLRQDNADRRLTEIGHKYGLIDEKRYQSYLSKVELIESEKQRLEKAHVGPSEKVLAWLEKNESTAIVNGISLLDLLKRPEISYADLQEIDKEKRDIPKHIQKQIEIDVKYAGYITKQEIQVRQFKKLEKKLLPQDINYFDIKGLRIEAQQKLDLHRPESVGRASRILGVSPADISVLLIYLEQINRGAK